ncbi:MAG TPA: hypothetical protein ENN68_02255 [Methanomicrobia archaeon]|nr:hypothetical protein [Methanomicrobia archaeon]
MTIVTYKMLRDKLRKGRIRGNWRVLNSNEKALYRVALAYTKPIRRRVEINGRRQEIEVGRTIVQSWLVQKLNELFEKLLETRGMKIFKRGFAKAVELQQRCGTVIWASSLPQWLKDPDFIFWLGAMRRGT